MSRMDKIIQIETPTPFGVGNANSFLLIGDTLSIVDVGTKFPAAEAAMIEAIANQGYAVTDIEQIILTHHHPDHIGLTDLFTNATVVGHAYNDFFLKRDQAFFDYQARFYLNQLREEGVPSAYNRWVEKMTREVAFMGSKPLTTYLKDGDFVPGHPQLQAIETLGHAQSHLIFVNEKERHAFGGDLLIELIASNPLIEPPIDPSMPRPKSQLQYNASLKKLAALELDTVFSGHGNPVVNSVDLVAQRIQKQQQRAEKVLALIDQPRSAFELTERVFPTKFTEQLGLTLSSTIGQLDYLVDERAVKTTLTDEGILLYEKA